MSRRVALVTGPFGQDGSYLTERLLADGYAVHGVARSADLGAPPLPGMAVHVADLADAAALRRIVLDVAPSEIYNLGGISSVAYSFDHPEETFAVNAGAVTTLLAAAEELGRAHGIPVHLVQAGSAEIFGEPASTPQDERTPIAPVSPYGAAKAAAHEAVRRARAEGVRATNVILYNHESPRRPVHFVTRRITHTVAAIVRGEASRLPLGNLDARRDWGWAPDYVDALLRAGRRSEPEDYVIATGVAHSVGDFVAAAFAHVGLTDWRSFVDVDPHRLRPADPSALVGRADRAAISLGWCPTVGFGDIVAAMVDADLHTGARQQPVPTGPSCRERGERA